MVLKCPKCERRDLTNASHGASRCPACGGLFIPTSRLHEYVESPETLENAQKAAGNDAAGGQCPSDRTIMSRTAVYLADRKMIHLERCNSCRGIWFDAGEWIAISENHLLEHIDELWSSEWRSRQRRAAEEREYRERLATEFGAELLAQIESLAAALRDHPRRSQALALLREESGS